MEDKQLRVVELFAGIGSQAQALENLGIPFTSTVCEIDKRAYESYCAIHGDVPNLGDITKVERLPECDLLTYSFPCQDLSIAGNQKGMKEGSGTRSSLLWEVGRLLKTARFEGTLPRYLLMENVDAILNKKNIEAFKGWMAQLEELGYSNTYQVLNAKDFGIPQNRKRCFMVSVLGGGRRFVFPAGFPLEKCLKDVLEDDVDESFYLSDERIARYQRHKEKHEALGHGFGWSPSDGEGVARCLNTVPTKDGQNFLVMSGNLNSYKHDQANRVYDSSGVSPAIQAQIGGDTTPKIEVVGDLGDPTRLESANRVYGVEGVAPTLPTGAGGGHIPRIESHIDYPCGTKKGYMPAHEGDGLVMNRVETARGTVQPQSVPTLTTGNGCGTGVVVKERSFDANDVILPIDDGDVCAMLTPGKVHKRQKGPRSKVDGTAFTITASDVHGVAENEHGKLRIRYLTPRECWRLMGFPDSAFDKAQGIGTCKTQLYKQAGNSIVVNVLEAIFKAMFIDDCWEKEPTLDVWCE